jgi:peptidoglycan hydrolase CwlO-like protein
MALEIKTPKLIINLLILVGQRKDYHVPFRSGLNIIYGDSDTGKSSILNLIDYCLGAKEVELYDEIEATGKYCLLEVELSGNIYTIKRDIFKTKDDIEVYHCTHDKIEDFFPKYYSPDFSSASKDGFFSDFLLSSINIPTIKIKQSPSKEDSDLKRVSFRNVFKYNFLNQDMVGSRKIFGDNFSKIVILKETFKLMFNVLDVQITELEALISEKTKDRDDLNRKNNSVSIFLRETQIDTLSVLEQKRKDIEDEIILLSFQIDKIDNEINSSSDIFNELRQSIYQLERDIDENNKEKFIKEQDIKQNIALKNEYDKDIGKMIAIMEVIEKLPNVDDKEIPCPVCDSIMKTSELKKHFVNSDGKSLKAEVNSLRRRQKDLQALINKVRDEIYTHDRILKIKNNELNDLKNYFDKQTKQIVTPYISQRDALTSRRGSLESDKKNIQHFFKIRQQQTGLIGEIEILEKNLTKLRSDLRELKENAPSLDNILNSLGDNLNDFLHFVGMKNVHGISISEKSFLPVIRSRDYEKVSSGGVRTLASVGYYLSLLEYAISNSVNYPSFLMVDTIAKYIGKTKDKYENETNRKDDLEEGMNDPDKYMNIYKYLLRLNKHSKSFQIIVVDNDIPVELRDTLKAYVVKHFETEADGIESQIGFIDDI